MQWSKKQYFKRIVSIVMVLMITFSVMPQNMYAAAFMSTEEIDVEEEGTENAQVYFVSKATRKLITVDCENGHPVSCNTDYDTGNVPDNEESAIIIDDVGTPPTNDVLSEKIL